MKKDKIRLFGMYMKKSCYHCGTDSGDLYTVRDYILKGNTIHVCETCRNLFHGAFSKVNAYLVEDMYCDVMDIPIEEAVKNVVNADKVFVKHKDPADDEVDALKACISITNRYYNRGVSYFYVESIKAFESIEELFTTIDTICSRGCVFFSRKEGIDTSTKLGTQTITAMKLVSSIHNKEVSNQLSKARAAKEAKRKPIEITDEFRNMVAQWRDKKISMKHISEATGMSIRTIYRRIKMFNL